MRTSLLLSEIQSEEDFPEVSLTVGANREIALVCCPPNLTNMVLLNLNEEIDESED